MTRQGQIDRPSLSGFLRFWLSSRTEPLAVTQCKCQPLVSVCPVAESGERDQHEGRADFRLCLRVSFLVSPLLLSRLCLCFCRSPPFRALPGSLCFCRSPPFRALCFLSGLSSSALGCACDFLPAQNQAKSTGLFKFKLSEEY